MIPYGHQEITQSDIEAVEEVLRSDFLTTGPEVALYLLEEEPRLLQTLTKITGVDIELRDDPMMRLDEFRMMSRPAGRDVTDLYAVA